MICPTMLSRSTFSMKSSSPTALPDRVADELMSFRDEVGPFGTVLHAGHDWADPALARRSMVLLAEQVVSRVDAGERKPARAVA